MGEFNYKKWLTENKYGKPNINYINEQVATVTYYGCSVCPEGAVVDNVPSQSFNYGNDVSGLPMCDPITAYVISQSDIQNNNQSDWDSDFLFTWSEYIGSNEAISQQSFLTLDSGSTYLNCSSSGVPVEQTPETDEIEPEDEIEVTEGACKKVTLCPACPSNNNYNPDRSYEIGGNLAQACGTWSINNCMTVDGATPELGQFVLIGSAQQVWMVWNVEEATTDALQDKQSTGCPELDALEPQGAPSPPPPPVPPGKGGEGDKFPQKDKKQKPVDKKKLKETWNRLKKLYKKRY